MKDAIIAILCKGYIRTKKYSLSDLAKRFYPILKIAEYNAKMQVIRCKENAFWDQSNKQNRVELIADLQKSKAGAKGMFSIYNRYENGDRYGIA